MKKGVIVMLKEKNAQIITFDSSASKEILELLDKTIDSKSYIVEKSNPTQRVLASDGEPLRIKEFAGLMKGSEIFIKSDITSLIKLADKIT